MLLLSLGALGVVYGDIGTSPLYALRECFYGAHGIPPTPGNVVGVLSLIFWTLLSVISVKYLVFILQADNRGEGGILALMALVRPGRVGHNGISPLVVIGLFGAALLYGDGIITPAISVLSAVEGLHVATPFFEPYVIPITIVVLVLLFLVQYQGTARVGAVFGPITLVWFVVLGLLGVREIVHAPHVLNAVNPAHAVGFLVRHGVNGLFVLGSVFLVVTGGEALYADMGHFGRRPIRITWYAVVLPGLLLNYFGQGALLLNNPEAAHNPFYRLVPEVALYPMVALATLATVIASQAVISGCFSLTRQAILLGYCPRIEIDHTSQAEIGQIYVGPVNWALMFATIGLVLGFGSSGSLAAAYGVAVSTTMVITTLLFYVLAREQWHWSRWGAGLLSGALLIFDVAFFTANIIKVGHGGWFPMVIATAVFIMLTTWKRGREILGKKLRAGALPVELFLEDIKRHPPVRVPGTAVFLTADQHGIPPSLLHNLKHNKVLHEEIWLLTVMTRDIPYVPRPERLEIKELGNGFHRIIAYYGFMEDPNIREILHLTRSRGLTAALMETTFFLGRETLIPAKKPEMAHWREQLFAFMSRNAQRPTAFFRIPPNRVVELGAQIEL